MSIYFGQKQTCCISTINGVDLYLKIPILKEESISHYQEERGKVYSKQNFHLLETDTQKLIGASTQPINYPLERTIFDIYVNLLKLTEGWNLCRIWNYVPYINDKSRGLENYQSFCKGRSLAFEHFYGADFEVKLPAGTGVGIADDTYAIYFIAVKENITNVENPEQVSAYKYPDRYGPRSPSFARGTVVTLNSEHIGYLSGTASIKGHESIGQGDIGRQFEVTLSNMNLVLERMGFNKALKDSTLYYHTFTIYLRNPSDLPVIQQMVENNFPNSAKVIYLNCDICRSELDIEIEATITTKTTITTKKK